MAAAGMIPGARAKGKKDPQYNPATDLESETDPEISEAPLTKKVIESSSEVDVPKAEETSESSESDGKEEIVEWQGLRAALLGHSGAGNFGHGLDRVFTRLDGVRLMAVSDEDDESVDEALARTGAPSGFSSYQQLFENEQPDLVAVCPRWTEERFAMVEASLIAGAHVYCEKPFTRTLKEADELLELASQNQLQIAVAHQMRCDPHLKRFHKECRDLIGDLLEMRVYGKMDQRVGGEDMLVLGTHLFDIVRWFAGDAQYCTAKITVDGEPALAEDAHESEREKIGPLLGDSIRAEFVMDSDVHVTFISDKRYKGITGHWGIDFVGSKTTMRLYANHPPFLTLRETVDPTDPDREDVWRQWPEVAGEYHPPFEKLTGMDAANRRVLKDLLESIEENRTPEASGYDAMKALEMIHGVWQAGITMKRAYFPLVNRLHPLSEESR